MHDKEHRALCWWHDRRRRVCLGGSDRHPDDIYLSDDLWWIHHSRGDLWLCSCVWSVQLQELGSHLGDYFGHIQFVPILHWDLAGDLHPVGDVQRRNENTYWSDIALGLNLKDMKYRAIKMTAHRCAPSWFSAWARFTHLSPGWVAAFPPSPPGSQDHRCR